jgi:hypothetical protein
MQGELVMSYLSTIIAVNNWWVRRRGIKVRPEEILLLLPHCLHRETCPRDVVHSLGECLRCGQCSVGELAGVREMTGVTGCMVGGGRQALQRAKEPGIKAVVAVACERELKHGILAAWPKPVLAVTNITPEGPCRNTLADPGKVAEAIRVFLA